MKVRYLTEVALEAIKRSPDDFLPCFSEETNAALVALLRERVGTDEIFRETTYVFPDAPLPVAREGASELEAVRAVFSAMKDLPPAVAMDERLWSGIAIDLCWNYLRKRWGIDELFASGDNGVKAAVLEHFFFMHNPRRSFTRNAISRLWWLGKLTYDESLADPFRRTGVVMQDLGYVVDLLERNFSNNPRITREFMDAVESARAEVAEKNLVILRPELRALCKYLNMLGGVYILDTMPEGGIYAKTRTKAISLARDSSRKPVDDEKVEDDADDAL